MFRICKFQGRIKGIVGPGQNFIVGPYGIYNEPMRVSGVGGPPPGNFENKEAISRIFMQISSPNYVTLWLLYSEQYCLSFRQNI